MKVGSNFSRTCEESAMKPTNSSHPSHKPAEQELIVNATKGNLEAFNQLVLIYQDIAYNHAHAILRDPVSAEDATQDSFIKAFQNINTFRGGSFRAWLIKIVTNSSYDILRRLQRHPIQPLFPTDEDGEEMESPSWLADPSESVEAHVEQGQFSKEIYRMLDELPDVYRSVLTLIDIHEMDYKEAAQALSAPLGTVKSRLARARVQMICKMRAESGYSRNIQVKGKQLPASAHALC